MTNADLGWWYRRYNKKYFGGKLPAATTVFSKLGGWLGECYHESAEIFINKDLRKWPRECKFTLLHEMAHLNLGWRVNHGPKFESEMLRLAKAGAFKGVW